MKSFESVGQCSSPLFVSPPLSFIDSTKVQEVVSGAKDKKDDLLSKGIKGFALNIYIYILKSDKTC